jgi:hypothetical protein
MSRPRPRLRVEELESRTPLTATSRVIAVRSATVTVLDGATRDRDPPAEQYGPVPAYPPAERSGPCGNHPRGGEARVRAYVEAARQLSGAVTARSAVTAAGAKWPEAGQLEHLLHAERVALDRARQAWEAIPPTLRGDLKAPDEICAADEPPQESPPPAVPRLRGGPSSPALIAPFTAQR